MITQRMDKSLEHIETVKTFMTQFAQLHAAFARDIKYNFALRCVRVTGVALVGDSLRHMQETDTGHIETTHQRRHAQVRAAWSDSRDSHMLAYPLILFDSCVLQSIN